jgi:predicted small metal-binding protein
MPSAKRSDIELVVRCDCGFEARGTEEKLVPLIQRHGREAHQMKVTREEALAMARPA